MAWLLALIVLQCVIAGVVIFVLKRLLDRELTEAAMEKLQALSLAGKQTLTITSCGILNEQLRQRLQSTVRRKTPDVKVIFEQDPALKGGLSITVGQESFDFSLAGRLKSFWS